MAKLNEEQLANLVKAYREVNVARQKATAANEFLNGKLGHLKNVLGLTTNEQAKIDEEAFAHMGRAYLELEHGA